MSGHQSSAAKSVDWFTPRWILDPLGTFDLDPCTHRNRPFDTARRHIALPDDGLASDWNGRVWLNPPYGKEVGRWLEKLARHNDGIALIFARTETRFFFDHVWDKADALLFLKGRVRFMRLDMPRRARTGGGRRRFGRSFCAHRVRRWQCKDFADVRNIRTFHQA